MSEIPSTTRCPKCGYNSQDDHICDACGAIFSKVRQREVEQEIMGFQENEQPAQAPGTVSGAGFLLKSILVLLVLGVAGSIYWYQAGQYKFPTTERLISWHRQIVAAVRKSFVSEDSVKDKTRVLEKQMNVVRKLLPMISELPAPRDSLDSIRLAGIRGANELATAELTALTDGMAAGDLPAMERSPLIATEWLLDVAENPYDQVEGANDIQAAVRSISPSAAEGFRQTVILIEDRRRQVRQELADSIEKSETEDDAAKKDKTKAE